MRIIKEYTVPTLKRAIYIFDVFYIISAIGAITMGIVMFMDMKNYSTFLGALVTMPILLAIAGFTAIIAAYLGYLAANKENHDRAILFARATSVIVVFELTVAVFTFLYILFLYPTVLKRSMLGLIKYRYKSSESQEKMISAWDSMQKGVKCCGALSPPDWTSSTFYAQHRRVPSSCCIDPQRTCDANDFNYIHTMGCQPAFLEKVAYDMEILLATAFGFGFIDVLGVVLASELVIAIRKVQETNKIKNVPRITITM